MTLRTVPTWTLDFAPRAMRATLASPTGNPLISLRPESAEGRHLFGDHAALIAAAPDLLAVLTRLMEWDARMGSFDAPVWDDARAAIAKARGEE